MSLHRSSLAILMMLTAGLLMAQGHTQTVRGTIVDGDTRQPLIGATVVLLDSDPLVGTTTDLDGRFALQHVPVGRIALQVRMLGYDEQVLANLLVNSAKELVLDVKMQESLTQLQEVVISGRKGHGEVRNDMAVMSARKISVEETSRIAGGINDPSRMVSTFPGVANDPAGDNTIIVRGNSPKGVLWRLEGMEIPNPNHFSDDGATGGPINVLNSDVIDNSDFYTGAFAAEYGNVTSAVFDMKLRDGNDRKREYTLKVGVLGTDLTAEGPITGVQGGSYLANYRYSSLALLDGAGIVDFQGVPKYQDAAFKVKLPAGKVGTFSLFGLGGRSSIAQEDKGVTGDTTFARTDFGSRMGIVGLTHTKLISDNNFLYTTLSLSGNGSETDHYATDAPGETDLLQRHVDDLRRWTWRFTSTLNTRVSAAHKLRSGVIVSHDQFRMLVDSWNAEDQRLDRQLDRDGGATTLQAFSSWKWRLNEHLSITSGVHVLHYAMNNSTSVEPRAALRYQVDASRAITLGAGLHSRTENVMTYQAQDVDADGRVFQPNRDLGLSRAAHAVLGYEQMLTEDIQFKAEAYYQRLYGQPVENRAAGQASDPASAFWLGNYDGWFTTKPLVNEGDAYNAGLELGLEKFFTRGWHALATVSLFESKYRAMDGVWRNSRYNLGAVANALAGREWKLGGEARDKVLLTGIRYSVMGGQWRTPIDLEASIAAGTHKESGDPWSVKGDPIHKVDMVVAYRVGRARVSHEVKADVQNVLNAQTPVYEYYNNRTQRIETINQLAMLPVLQYTLRF
ncbi:MAG: TonB-dependent receptor [Flavobacteriales bacterium]|nr:TonB-dependent receptor [Flavobacteriales bacterium]